MNRTILQLLMMLVVVATMTTNVAAREGDTLLPIEIEAPELEVSPPNLMNSDDVDKMERRIQEARNSGVPLAVRIVDMTQERQDIPFQMRQFADLDFSQPFSIERQDTILQEWIDSEPIESSDGANDGFLLLVLVPEDRTQTQAMWWIGPNALPLNGLTQENILATHTAMNTQFAAGNMPNGVYQGISEFSYYIQFGEPERLTRSTLRNALNWAVLPVAAVTALAGIAIPALAWWCSRRNTNADVKPHRLDPWEAAALHEGRARSPITAAMLLEDYHEGRVSLLVDGGLKLYPHANSSVIEALRPYAEDDGIVDKTAMIEIEGITAPVRSEIENELANIGAMTTKAHTDRTQVFVAMGITVFLIVLSTVPTIVSMSAAGAYAIGIATIGILIGWWWLRYRRYTSPGGERMLAEWLETASADERHLFDSAINQNLLIDHIGGPDVTRQNQLIRAFRGLGAG